MSRSEEFLLPGIETMKLFQGIIYSQVPASCHFWGRWTIWEDLISSEIIQEDRIHSTPQVNNEWDLRESKEDRGDLTTSSPQTRWARGATKGVKTKVFSRDHAVVHRAQVGAVRTKRCSHHGAGRCWPTAGCSSASVLRTNLVPLPWALCYCSILPPPNKHLFYLASFCLSVSSSPRTTLGLIQTDLAGKKQVILRTARYRVWPLKYLSNGCESSWMCHSIYLWCSVRDGKGQHGKKVPASRYDVMPH